MRQYKLAYKLAAFDMDETLLAPDASLSEYAVGVLRAIEKTGAKIVPCTGRPYGGTLPHLRRIGLETWGVFCNGAQIRGALSGDILSEYPMLLEDALAATRMGEEAGGHTRLYMGDRVYVAHIVEDDRRYIQRTGSAVEEVGNLYAFLEKNLEANSNHSLLKLMNVMPDPESVPALFEKSRRFFEGRLYVTQSLLTFVEYMRADASKGIGLKILADRWGIAKEDIVVAGDHLNDLTLFAEAGFSIAPQNARPAVREAASCVCRSNAEDGVARKLAEIFEISL
ncbi:MAG: HAD hydrolase family protein [Synergistaceae bacterium]|jgi:Cof subfamily protein (haloacid dehalogenase superfamily)|nr:HAD hydrolase family protein [Synergistaceae bacterium]